MSTKERKIYTDLLIIGSGCAGLTAALEAAKTGQKVLILSKRELRDSNTYRAQGGISSVTITEDSFDSHIQDTLNAGGELCNLQTVESIIKQGPEVIDILKSYGVKFTTRAEAEPEARFKESKELHLGKEGGHSNRRVLHAGDITGEKIIETLLTRCEEHPNITTMENTMAIDLIVSQRLGVLQENQCFGAYALTEKKDQVITILANNTILATGGAGKVYLFTTNPDVAIGDGIAMGYRAYATIANMEFFQFHPTCLYHPKAKNFLVSEAVRGEGAILKIRKNGKMVPFMDQYHPMASLAPRDIVARAIDKELKLTGEASVFLDITHQSQEFIQRRFPNIYKKCLECGIDMSKDLIPVVPAAHYCCGGIKTDINGFTDIKGLYAIGETACTGLHGANRLASNSLLECLVTAVNAVRRIKKTKISLAKFPTDIPFWDNKNTMESDEHIVITHNWKEIRQFMWDYVGISRTSKRLKRAKSRIKLLRYEINEYYWDTKVSQDLIELRNLASVAEMIIDAAIKRGQNYGLHFNEDHKNIKAESNPSPSLLKRQG
jgi:L-aspartate oxidase